MSDATPSPTPARRRISPGIALVFIAIVAILAMLGWGLRETNKTQPVSGEQARKFQMAFFEGFEWQEKTVADLDEMEGNIVVLNFWASWCIQCRDESALFEQAWRQYQDDGVLFLGIAYVDIEPKSREYMEEFSITFPNAPDLRSAISDAYRITGVPETYIIDRDGTITFTKEGALTADELYTELTALTGVDHSGE